MRIQLVQWSLRRRPLRSLLNSVSVGITVAVLIVFFSARSEIQRFLVNSEQRPHQRLWVKPRNLASRMTYPLALKDQLAKVPNVETVQYNIWTGVVLNDETISIQACSERIPEIEDDLVLADPPTVEAWKKDKLAAIITDRLAELLHVKVGQESELSLETPKGNVPMKFHVVGIVDGSRAGHKVVVHYEYLDQLLGNRGVVTDFRIVLDRKTDDRPVIAAVNQVLASYSSQLLTEKTMLQVRGVKSAGLIPSLLGALGIVLLVTTALGIANATVIAVRERRAEIATLRVVGVRKSILWQSIIGESVFICVLGGLAGAALAWYVMRDGLTLGQILQSIKVTKTGLIAGLATSLLVPLIGSTTAAWLAVRAPLHEALRNV